MNRLFSPSQSFASAKSVASLIVACALLASCGARKDGFDWSRVVLFSAIAGTLVKDGKPVANATITREANFHGSKHSDSTVTDKDGKFSFGTMKAFTLLYQVLPHEPMTYQKMTAHVTDKDNEIWYHPKSGYENNSELKYYILNKQGHIEFLRIEAMTNPILVECELGREMKKIGDVISKCEFVSSNAEQLNNGSNQIDKEAQRHLHINVTKN
jgi:hypothetical protein